MSFNVSEVAIAPGLPADVESNLRSLLSEYREVFTGEQDSLSKPFAADPVELKFVANTEPQSIPEPRWTFAQKQILTSSFGYEAVLIV